MLCGIHDYYFTPSVMHFKQLGKQVTLDAILVPIPKKGIYAAVILKEALPC